MKQALGFGLLPSFAQNFLLSCLRPQPRTNYRLTACFSLSCQQLCSFHHFLFKSVFCNDYKNIILINFCSGIFQSKSPFCTILHALQQVGYTSNSKCVCYPICNPSGVAHFAAKQQFTKLQCTSFAAMLSRCLQQQCIVYFLDGSKQSMEYAIPFATLSVPVFVATVVSLRGLCRLSQR